MNNFLRSEMWARWLELRKRTFLELSQVERTEYRKLKRIVCKELVKLNLFIPLNKIKVKNESLSRSG